MTIPDLPVQSRLPWHYRWMMGLLGLFAPWLDLSCRSFMHLASEKHERELHPGERLRQGMHRAMCSVCRVQERHLDQLRDLAHEAVDSALDEQEEQLSDEATDRIRQAMAEAAESPSASEPQ